MREFVVSVGFVLFVVSLRVFSLSRIVKRMVRMPTSANRIAHCGDATLFIR